MTKTWFRIELDSSGAILSCAEVDRSERSGKLVRFVEAGTAAEACSAVKEWYAAHLSSGRMRNALHREARRAAGLCTGQTSGCTGTPRIGFGTCDNCALVSAANHRLRRLRKKLGDTADLRLSNGGAQSVRDAHLAGINKRSRARREAAGGAAALEALRLLRKFDSLGPEAFRAWLVSKIPALAMAAE